LPAPAALPVSPDLPTAFPFGCETCAAGAAPFFGAGFFSFFCSCAPLAANASARLQIKTRNILISFFSFWVVRPFDVFIYSTSERYFLDAS
jgi:hypothetical protein